MESYNSRPATQYIKICTLIILITSNIANRFFDLFNGSHLSFSYCLSHSCRSSAGCFPLLVIAIFFFLLYKSQNLNKHEKEIRGGRLPPGPVALPIVGSLPMMLWRKPRFRWALQKAEGKDITCILLGNVHVIVVNSPEFAREFLKKNDANFTSRPITMATEYSGRGFLSAVIAPWGDQWKKMRRVIASEVINHKRFQSMAKLRGEEADNLVRYIQYQSKAREVIDVRKALRYYSGNIIRRMIFGCRHFGMGAKDGGPGPGPEEIEHVEAAFTVLSLIYAFCASDFMPSLRTLDIDGHERVMKKAIKVINKYHDPIIEERMRRWRTDGGVDDEPEDILDVFISLKDDKGKPLLTMEEIKAQAAELIFATVDNPSNTVEWVMAEMLNQPDILRKAIDELNHDVGPHCLVEESDFPNLPYLKACAREALRLHPVAPFNLPHVSFTNTTVAGFFIPKGSQVLLSRVGLGRNPKVWEDPMRFNPDRHLIEKNVELAETDLRFISFSAGRRGCIGAQLGTMMTYMLLARVLHAFTWTLPAGEELVNLSEEEHSLFMAKPLHALANSRFSQFSQSSLEENPASDQVWRSNYDGLI
ncbi:phenylalanine N-monooxygenase-like [Dioscorea cayenensis subsp. rotundata]|uniref:Phenylalanine N-monooxygenase-like n=1 Tax=Dioscorea cayennensis subsp. rotundata TaxID=55577 RepID=A0AB40BYY3_DIOCR|nr:phenylalanine N-monooxygenase-like [Dioscorea cayenensis subsp. rotundata]